MHITTTNEKRNGNFEKARKVCWRFWRRESEGEVMEVCYNLKNKLLLKISCFKAWTSMSKIGLSGVDTQITKVGTAVMFVTTQMLLIISNLFSKPDFI